MIGYDISPEMFNVVEHLKTHKIVDVVSEPEEEDAENHWIILTMDDGLKIYFPHITVVVYPEHMVFGE